jgi:hypothetical protein
MQRQCFLESSTVLCLIVASGSYGTEVRKYSFVGDAPAFQFSCGECSGPPHWIRGQVEGAFEVTLDFEHGVGTLNTLDARLSNVEGIFDANIWQPIEWAQEFLLPGDRYDLYRPPYSGVLTPAAFRPLGPGTLTAAHMAPYLGVPTSQIPTEVDRWLSEGVGFEAAPAESWILYFDGVVENPDDQSASLGASFLIYFEENHADFSYYIPIIDAVPSIAAASAMLVPEPTGIALMCLVLTWPSMIRRRVGFTNRAT